MTNSSEKLTRRLSAIIQRQQQILVQLNDVLTGADSRPGERERLNAQMARHTADYQRVTEELKLFQLEAREVDGKRRARHSGRTLREQTLDILDEIGVPLAPGNIVEFAAATTGIVFAASRYASLRRDEERAATRDRLAKPAWIAPAISAESMTAMPRLLTSTAWPSARRIIGPRTPRVNHLRAVLAYLKRFELLQKSDQTRAKYLMEGLIWRHARAVPGATHAGESPDLERIRSAVKGELSLIELEDESDRQQAAARLDKLSPAFRWWGRLTLVDGDLPSGMRA